MRDHAPRSDGHATLRCVTCGYDVGVEGATACPECGAPIDLEYRAMLGRRAALERGFAPEVARHAAVWATVIVVYAIGAGAIDPSRTTGLEAAAAMGAVVVASALPALVLAMVASSHDRRVVALAWIRSLGWMHGPWLMVGPAALVAFVVALAGRELGAGKGPVKWILVPGAFVWLMGDGLCLARALIAFERRLSRHGVAGVREAARRRIVFVALVGVVLVWAAALGLGAVGGVHAAMNAVWFAGWPAWWR